MSKKYVLRKNDSFIEVKKGWSWVAFFFPGIWLLIKGLYKIFFFYFIFAFFLNIISRTSEEPIFLIFAVAIGFVLHVYCGINGNNWNKENLIKKGYFVIEGEQ